MTEPAQRADDRLTLRVENLRFGHHMNDHSGHRRSSSGLPRRQLYRRPGGHGHEAMYASHNGAVIEFSTESSAIAGQATCGPDDQSVSSLIVLLATCATR